ncbi:MAG: hypothetical protein D8H97_15455 [Neisseria sp.]|nr:MAG: hypothetical protein D8H97_15455 [Neisseria sp.]
MKIRRFAAGFRRLRRQSAQNALSCIFLRKTAFFKNLLDIYLQVRENNPLGFPTETSGRALHKPVKKPFGFTQTPWQSGRRNLDLKETKWIYAN